MEEYLKLLEIAKADVTACELLRRCTQAAELFAAAVKEYGDADRAAAHTCYEFDSSRYYHMLEGYLIRLAQEQGYDDAWTVASDAIRDWTETD